MDDLTRLNRIFDEAVALPESERVDFIERASKGDAQLLERLRALLERDAEADTPLDTPLSDLVGAVMEPEPEPERIGPYRLVREIGRGGMGAVFLGSREDGQFEQQVAIKLVKRGMDSDEVLRRFQSERQILAKLVHPHVARLYDGGVAEDGRPYLTMEYVEGTPITKFADSRKLTLERRLELFDAVASAVRFAHLNLVVHRDLKPNNVLVTEHGVVKLLDFGIAKILDNDASGSDLTQAGHRVLTPGYAAPEQTDGGAITTATDVFSLGVLLHELLTGRRPVWRGEDALRPSTTVRTVISKSTPTANAEQAAAGNVGYLSRMRGTTPERLSADLRGDLDAILLKALERDATHRYQTVDAFMEDLARYRDGRPVTARRPTPSYRLARLVRRNRLAVGAGAAVFASMAVGLGVAIQQRNIAIQERNSTEAVTAYLEGMFESVNPVGLTPGADTLRVADFLDRSTEAALTDLADQPAARARLLRTLGRAHFSLGDAERARVLWTQSAAAYDEAGLPEDDKLMLGLAEAAIELGDWERADSVLANTVAGGVAAERDRTVVRALALQARSLLMRNRADEADEVLETVIPAFRSLGDGEQLADALVMRTNVAWQRRDTEAALSFQIEAIELYRHLRGADDAQLAVALTNLSVMQRAVGDAEAAEASISEAIRIHELRTDPTHSTYVRALMTHANLLTQLGELARADSLFVEATTNAAGPSSAQTLIAVLSNHAANRRSAGDTARALALAQQAVSTAEGVFGGTPAMLNPVLFLAMMQDFAGDSTEAEQNYGRAIEAGGTAIASTHTGRMIAVRGVARGLARRGRYQEAEATLVELLEALPPGAPVASEQYELRQTTLDQLISVYRRWGRDDDVDKYEAIRATEAGAADSPRATGP